MISIRVGVNNVMTNRCPRCAKLLHCGAFEVCPKQHECDDCEHDVGNNVCSCSFSDLVNHIEMLNTELLQNAHTIERQQSLIDRLKGWVESKQNLRYSLLGR